MGSDSWAKIGTFLRLRVSVPRPKLGRPSLVLITRVTRFTHVTRHFYTKIRSLYLHTYQPHSYVKVGLFYTMN